MIMKRMNMMTVIRNNSIMTVIKTSNQKLIHQLDRNYHFI
jgi:hypothetical protein